MAKSKSRPVNSVTDPTGNTVSIIPSPAAIYACLLSRRAVADMLGTHPKTVYRYQRQGLLPAIVFNRSLVRYKLADVEKLIASSLVA